MGRLVLLLALLASFVKSAELFQPSHSNLIVSLLNLYRSEGLPIPAGNMLRLTWNPELVYQAAVNVDHCRLGLPTDKFTSFVDFAGQTKATLESFIARALREWGEVEKNNILLNATVDANINEPVGEGLYNNFSQIVWAKSFSVGCAYTVCSRYRTLQCRFASVGNVDGEGWFTYGAGATICPPGTLADVVTGLCSLNSPPSNETMSRGVFLTPDRLNTVVSGSNLTANALRLNIAAIGSESRSASIAIVGTVGIGATMIWVIFLIAYDIGKRKIQETGNGSNRRSIESRRELDASIVAEPKKKKKKSSWFGLKSKKKELPEVRTPSALTSDIVNDLLPETPEELLEPSTPVELYASSSSPNATRTSFKSILKKWQKPTKGRETENYFNIDSPSGSEAPTVASAKRKKKKSNGR